MFETLEVPLLVPISCFDVVWSLIHEQLFCDTMDCSPPVSTAHGISQVRILKWIVIFFSRGSSRPGDWTHISHNGRRVLYYCVTREALELTLIQFSCHWSWFGMLSYHLQLKIRSDFIKPSNYPAYFQLVCWIVNSVPSPSLPHWLSENCLLHTTIWFSAALFKWDHPPRTNRFSQTLANQFLT